MEYRCCTLCPHACKINRLDGQPGRCGTNASLRAARAALHFWEEPCLSGTRGSGAIFFSGCPLHCVYCQNEAISSGQAGTCISTRRLYEIFFELEAQGAHNINLVTPTHFLPHIRQALTESKADGLRLPVIYNSSGYETPEALRMLEGLIDIYLPDFKYWSSTLAAAYSHAPDYPSHARAALAEMVRQTEAPAFDADGMMVRGTIVRHLLLPGCLEDAKAIVQYLYSTYGERIWISLMNQYTPIHPERLPSELRRTVSPEEYDALVDYALAIGVENGFIQEGGTAEESFIPSFDNEGVLRPPQ